MGSSARWRDWRPSGLQSPGEIDPATKPSKPSEPSPESAAGPASGSAFGAAHGAKPSKPAEPPATSTRGPHPTCATTIDTTDATGGAPVVPEIVANELRIAVAAFARIGSDTAAREVAGGFEGSEGFAPGLSQENAETRLGPGASARGGFEGFDRFARQRDQKNVIEARLHASGMIVFSAGSQYPQPTGFRTVVAGYGSDQVGYTAARHHIREKNFLGQDGVEYPVALVNVAAWRRTPCDLRHARWFRTEKEAIDEYRPRAPAPPPPEPAACVAEFSGGVQVELRRENTNRSLMWKCKDGQRTRKKDFASPSLYHAKRTAAIWYGDPVSEWKELKDDKPAERRQTRRK